MRVQYYTDSDRHMGWTKWDFVAKYAELKNWVQSGNYLKVNGYYIRSVGEFETFARVYQ